MSSQPRGSNCYRQAQNFQTATMSQRVSKKSTRIRLSSLKTTQTQAMDQKRRRRPLQRLKPPSLNRKTGMNLCRMVQIIRALSQIAIQTRMMANTMKATIAIGIVQGQQVVTKVLVGAEAVGMIDEN